MVNNAVDWTDFYNKDAECVRPLNMRVKRFGAYSVSARFLLPFLSRDDERFQLGFVYFEWPDREGRVFYLEFSL